MPTPTAATCTPEVDIPRRRWIARAALAAAGPLVAGLSACAAPGGDDDRPPWPSRPWLLLGEIHDNPAHHRLRADGLARLLADGLPTTVLFEQMDRGLDAAIAAATSGWRPDLDAARRAAVADGVADAGGLDRSGWAWPLHRPLVEAALAGGARVGGANLPLAQVRGIVREGLAAAPADVRSLVEGDRRWDDARRQVLEGLIDTGHCGMLPRPRWAAMALGQRARDAAMALAMVDAARRGARRVVLVAGNGHVRRDIGVPHHLLAVPGAAIRPEAIHAVAYLERGSTEPRDATLYDQVLVTEGVPGRPDPCEAFRRSRGG